MPGGRQCRYGALSQMQRWRPGAAQPPGAHAGGCTREEGRRGAASRRVGGGRTVKGRCSSCRRGAAGYRRRGAGPAGTQRIKHVRTGGGRHSGVGRIRHPCQVGIENLNRVVPSAIIGRHGGKRTKVGSWHLRRRWRLSKHLYGCCESELISHTLNANGTQHRSRHIWQHSAIDVMTHKERRIFH